MSDLWLKIASLSFLETNRLYLRPFTYNDWDDFYKISGEKERLPFVFPRQFSPAEARMILLKRFLKAPLGKWALEEKHSQRVIGAIFLENLSETKKETELEYFLHPNYWGKGLMPEVVQLISQKLEEIGLEKQVIVTHLENKASQRVAEKSGFQLVKQYRGSDRYTHQVRIYQQYLKKTNVNRKNKEGQSYDFN